ncbi:Aconitase [Rhodotorula toruloides ATCC 204091]|nr:Aconitase [Rhodotorula toruloides ATCC 204091]
MLSGLGDDVPGFFKLVLWMLWAFERGFVSLCGKSEDIPLQHTFNAGQITWHRAGSALNHMAKSKQ